MRARFPASNSRDHQQSKLGFLSIATPTDGNCVEGIETFYDALDDLHKDHFNEDALNEETFHDCLDNFSNEAGLDPEQKSALREAGSAIYNSIKDSFTSFTDAVLSVTKGEGASYGAKAIALGAFLSQFVTVSADDATTFSTDSTSTSDFVTDYYTSTSSPSPDLVGSRSMICDNSAKIPTIPSGFPTNFTGISMQDCTVDGVQIHKDDIFFEPMVSLVHGMITNAVLAAAFARTVYALLEPRFAGCCSNKDKTTEVQDEPTAANTTDIEAAETCVDGVILSKEKQSQLSCLNLLKKRFTNLLNRQQSRVTYWCGLMHGYTHMISADTRYMILSSLAGLYANGTSINICNFISTFAVLVANLIGYFGLPPVAVESRNINMALVHFSYFSQLVGLYMTLKGQVVGGTSLMVVMFTVTDYCLGNIQATNNALSGHIGEKPQQLIYGKALSIGESVCGIVSLAFTLVMSFLLLYSDRTLIEPHLFIATTLIGYSNFAWMVAHFMDFLFRKTEVGAATYELQRQDALEQQRIAKEIAAKNVTIRQKFGAFKDHIGAGIPAFMRLLLWSTSMGNGYMITCTLFTRVLPDMIPGAIPDLRHGSSFFLSYMIFNTAPRSFTAPLVNRVIAPIDMKKERGAISKTLVDLFFWDRSKNSESVENFLSVLEESHRSNAEDQLVQCDDAKKSIQEILEFLKEAAKSVPMIDSESKDATVATESEDSATDDVKINPVDKLIQVLQNAVTFENPEQDAEATREFFEKLIEDLPDQSEVNEVDVTAKLKEFLTSLKKPNTVINPWMLHLLHVCRLVITFGGSIAAMQFPALRNFYFTTTLSSFLALTNGFLFTLASNTCQRLSTNPQELGSIPLMTNLGVVVGFLLSYLMPYLVMAVGVDLEAITRNLADAVLPSETTSIVQVVFTTPGMY